MIIGLTGGIASGKSTVSARLAELGALIIDADRVARNVVELPEVASALCAEFGMGIFRDGRLDRAALAEAAFNTPEGVRRLNAVTHPHIIRIILDTARRNEGSYPLVVIDAPLLVESGLHDVCGEIWLVTADAEMRISRVAARDGLDRRQAEARMANQLSDAEKRRYATLVLDNNGSVEELMQEVDAAFYQTVKGGL